MCSHLLTKTGCLLTVIMGLSAAAPGQYSGGSGTEADPWQIATVGDLLALGQRTADYGGHFRLTADIDLADYHAANGPFTTAVVAPDADGGNGTTFDGTSFTGVFDGGGHVIRHLTIDDGGAGNDFLGLFGRIEGEAEIRDVGLESGSVLGGEGSLYAAGLVGFISDGEVTACYTTVTVVGDGRVGGLVGLKYHGTITSCYATGAVSGKSYVGGLVGLNYFDWIRTCYATGVVSGHSVVDPLVGSNRSGLIASSYFLDTGGDGGHGSPRSDAEMRQQASFSGFDFESTWAILEGRTYPYLAWQTFSDEDCDGDGVPDALDAIQSPALDCNGNGVPDECDLAAGTADDCNANGVPDECDTDCDANGVADECEAGWYSGGRGTADDPWQIATAEDLVDLGDSPCHYGNHFVLTTDIDLAGYHAVNGPFTAAVIAADTINADATVAGRITFDGTPFTGVFDGDGHVIRNLTIDDGGQEIDYVGLFGKTESSAEIRDLGLAGASVTGGGFFVGGLVAKNEGAALRGCRVAGSIRGYRYVGALVGDAGESTITSCSAAGDVSGEDTVGGLVGWNLDGSITSCGASGDVSGVRSVGGLVGSSVTGEFSARHATITSCYATGAVSGTESVGGLAGHARDCPITSSYATGAVAGAESVGGLVGANTRDGSVPPIASCYATGTVDGEDKVGGLVGRNGYGPITACYATGVVTGGGGDVGGLAGASGDPEMLTFCYFLDAAGPDNGLGVPLSDAAMRRQASFDGFDFTSAWANYEGLSYPYLAWQAFSGDDCNANGVPDEFDIAVGSSGDVDGDGVPDECDAVTPSGVCPAASTLMIALAVVGLVRGRPARRIG